MDRTATVLLLFTISALLTVKANETYPLQLAFKCSSVEDCEDFGFVCVNNQCQSCAHENDDVCRQYGAMQSCQVDKTGIGRCVRKDLLPISLWDVVLSLFLLIAGAAAAGGGVGGGGIFVPLLVTVGRFDIKSAIALSNCLIVGAAVANFVLLSRKRHPTSDKPLINYKLSFFLMPLALGGTSIGVIFNQILPAFILLVLLTLVLAVTIWKTARTALFLDRKERAQNITSEFTESFPPLQDAINAPTPPGEAGSIPSEVIDPVRLRFMDDNEHNFLSEVSQLNSIRDMQKSERNTPWAMLCLQMLLVCVLAFLSLAKGSARVPSIFGIAECSALFWILLLCPLPILWCLSYLWGVSLFRETQRKITLRYPWLKSDIQWTKKKIVVTGFVGFLAGTLSSCIGIGGGMLLGPVLLELGALPDVAAATSSFMILFTSLLTVLQFSFLGLITLDYGILFGFVGLISAFLGQTSLNWLVKRYNKKSYIVWSVALVIVISTVLLIYTGTSDLVGKIKTGENWYAFRNFCSE